MGHESCVVGVTMPDASMVVAIPVVMLTTVSLSPTSAMATEAVEQTEVRGVAGQASDQRLTIR